MVNLPMFNANMFTALPSVTQTKKSGFESALDSIANIVGKIPKIGGVNQTLTNLAGGANSAIKKLTQGVSVGTKVDIGDSVKPLIYLGVALLLAKIFKLF